MTTICTNGKVIAADTKVIYYGVVPGRTAKIDKINPHTILAAAGDTVAAWRARNFFSEDDWLLRDPLELKDYEFEALLWYKGKIFILVGSTVPHLLGESVFAIGSGGQYARAGLELGLTPEDAIKLASKLDVNTNGEVEVVRLPKYHEAKPGS